MATRKNDTSVTNGNHVCLSVPREVICVPEIYFLISPILSYDGSVFFSLNTDYMSTIS
jgi:hypothetical protein